MFGSLVVDPGQDPIDLFEKWMKDAQAMEPSDAEAMCLSTVSPMGTPSSRILLLKGLDRDGFVFFTNKSSDKGIHLDTTPQAALCFHWKSLRRQVRIEGPVIPATDFEADQFFSSRPRESQIGAWASQQSRPLKDKAELETLIRNYTERFMGGPVPRPPSWVGYRLTPIKIEFWQEQPFRLHDRFVYTRERPTRESPWIHARLFP